MDTSLILELQLSKELRYAVQLLLSYSSCQSFNSLNLIELRALHLLSTLPNFHGLREHGLQVVSQLTKRHTKFIYLLSYHHRHAPDLGRCESLIDVV